MGSQGLHTHVPVKGLPLENVLLCAMHLHAACHRCLSRARKVLKNVVTHTWFESIVLGIVHHRAVLDC